MASSPASTGFVPVVLWPCPVHEAATALLLLALAAAAAVFVLISLRARDEFETVPG